MHLLAVGPCLGVRTEVGMKYFRHRLAVVNRQLKYFFLVGGFDIKTVYFHVAVFAACYLIADGTFTYKRNFDSMWYMEECALIIQMFLTKGIYMVKNSKMIAIWCFMV